MSFKECEQQGHKSIAAAVKNCKSPIIVIEMLRMFGDVLHSTIAVQHYRRTRSDASIVWAISERYVDTFSTWIGTSTGPHVIAILPEVPLNKDGTICRQRWVKQASTLTGVESAFACGVSVGGWPCGDIVTATLRNAGIEMLAVPRQPYCPVTLADTQWADAFIVEHKLQHFVLLEFESVTLASLRPQQISELVAGIHVPVVAVAGPQTPIPTGTIDGRCTFRQARALMQRATCFVGITSGLTVLAASCPDLPVVEFGPIDLSMERIGYRGGRVYRHVTSIAAAVPAVNGALPCYPPKQAHNELRRGSRRKRAKG